MSQHQPCSEFAYESIAFTVEALAARADEAELTRLADRVRGVLTDWENLHATRRLLRRAALQASAHVHVADATLDSAIGTFAREVVAVSGRDSALYQRFFPESHEEIIAMGLESELPVVTLVLAQLDTSSDVPAPLAAHAVALRAGLRLGNAALANRADALADLGRHSAREESWGETSLASLVSVRRTLEKMAVTRGLPASWVSAFFR
jgi:hypothetical protein